MEIYNGSSIYNQGGGGGGGGGGEFVEIQGIKYRPITVGGQTWLDRNLYYTWPELTINPNTQTNSAFGASKDTFYKCALGLSYNKAAVNYLQANRHNLFDGWKIPTLSDYNQLIANAGGVDKICNCIFGGSDLYGLNFMPDGLFNSYNNSWNGAIVQMAVADSDPDFLFVKDFSTVIDTYETVYKWMSACVRLIKDE